jgi:hypothetical protein
VSEAHWQGSGDVYTLSWGGRPWTLRLDEPDPGLRLPSEQWSRTSLSLHGLGATGRFAAGMFTPATLVDVEHYRSRIQATFAPPGWGGLLVRAAWSPSCAGAGVDLEVQASASSVGELRAVELVVQSQWRRATETDLPSAPDAIRSVAPRDARSSALTYDGRETAASVQALKTLGFLDNSRPRMVERDDMAPGALYVEMVQPNDLSRQIQFEPSEAGSRPPSMAVQYALFGHDMEKGIVLRGRLRACWTNTERAVDVAAFYQQFLSEPLPLGP